ncbi:MAG: type III-A CRISPR-associated RAMP protein Csm5 [Prevotellaceae bacterium]|jgi:CRISPR-associated protein Csm5|nr:type III-A CRISPR-associated RAMP protein Csm5 [Prevotellaceae bacterium]
MTEKTKLKITTITPVTIGSGVELSPYADYIIDNNQICFIDKKKMQDKILAKGDQHLDNYIYGVANGIDNNHIEFNLNDFLLNNKIVEDINEIISSRCQFTTNTPQSKLPIKGMIKSPLQEPYFPGSSIKGALKTVLMYNWLKTNKNADEMIEKVINDKNFNWLEKKFEYKELDDGRSIPNTIRQVSDSKLLPKEANVVVDCYRAGLPLRFECIDKGTTTEFELTLEDYKWEDLAEEANDYAFDCLSQEEYLIKRQIKQLSKVLDKCEDEESATKLENFIEKLTNLKKHLLTIQDLIDESNIDMHTAYLRIGFGKGYYLNSLGVTIYDYVSQKGKEVLRNSFENYLQQTFKRKDLVIDDFPKTRLFVSKTQEPLGWVKIEKIGLLND